MIMDRIDRNILAELQRDCAISIAQLADRVGLSQSPCWKRVQKLEDARIIVGRVAVVDPLKVGLGLTVLAELEALDHTTAWRSRFLAAVQSIPEIMEVFRLGGASDYLLRIVVPDMVRYDAIYRNLTDQIELKSVTSKFVMERVHVKATLPIDNGL
ncbi:MAG: Lrp/AsnC family transcriptional regulator [Paracoccaceae bacterium]|jgi:Lrp/AsnC family transcriptional regulator